VQFLLDNLHAYNLGRKKSNVAAQYFLFYSIYPEEMAQKLLF